jgi:hypothetical protein
MGAQTMLGCRLGPHFAFVHLRGRGWGPGCDAAQCECL